MSKVKRYWPEEIVGTGELVVYAQDYAALEAECERLRERLEVAKSDELNASVWAETEAIRHEMWDAQRERDALAAELAAIKGQEPVAFYWQDIGCPARRKHGPYFGWPTPSALSNVGGRAVPVPLYALPTASEGGEV